jgi:hypothetical protein
MSLRVAMLRVMPFVSRWVEVAPAACCGVCPTCIGATLTGLALPMVVGDKSKPASTNPSAQRDAARIASNGTLDEHRGSNVPKLGL